MLSPPPYLCLFLGFLTRFRFIRNILTQDSVDSYWEYTFYFDRELEDNLI